LDLLFFLGLPPFLMWSFLKKLSHFENLIPCVLSRFVALWLLEYILFKFPNHYLGSINNIIYHELVKHIRVFANILSTFFIILIMQIVITSP
jgi:hypothetical protein